MEYVLLTFMDFFSSAKIGVELEMVLSECFRQGSPRKRKGPIAGTKGTDRLRSEEPFYVNPLPDCLCHRESPSSNTSQIS